MDERMEWKTGNLKTTGKTEDHRALFSVCHTRNAYAYVIHLSERDAPKYEVQNTEPMRPSQCMSYPYRILVGHIFVSICM